MQQEQATRPEPNETVQQTPPTRTDARENKKTETQILDRNDNTPTAAETGREMNTTLDIRRQTEILKQMADPNCPPHVRAALIKQLNGH